MTRGRWSSLLSTSCRLVLLASWCLIVQWGSRATVPNLCVMTRMRPMFEEVEIGNGASHYRVLRYREGGRAICEENGRILFVPGNGGSFAQARSLGSELSPSQAVYSIDLRGEHAAFDGRMLARQARFVKECVRLLKPLAIVGHSIGGIVAVLAAIEDDDVFVVTLATPLARHPFVVDVVLDRLTRIASARNRQRSLSISGGVRDWQIPDWLSASNYTVTDLSPPSLSTDHQSILWCNQIVRIVANFLLYISKKEGNGANFFRDLQQPVATSLLQSSTLGFASRFRSQHDRNILVVISRLGIWALPRSIAITAALLLDERVCKITLAALVAIAEVVVGDSTTPLSYSFAASVVLLVLADILSVLRRFKPRNRLRFVAARRGTVVCCALALSVAGDYHALPCLVTSALLARDETAAVLAACTSVALLPGYVAVVSALLSERNGRPPPLGFPSTEECLLSVLCVVVALAPSPYHLFGPVSRTMSSVAALWCAIAAVLDRPRYLIDCALAYHACSLALLLIACTSSGIAYRSRRRRGRIRSTPTLTST